MMKLNDKKTKNLKNIDVYPIPTVCPYCGCNVVFTSNAEVYGKKYGNGMCYKCTNCDAYVGVHTGTHIPLGRLANKKLRELKKQCHDAFDVFWKTKRERSVAYQWLADELNIPLKSCHFGWFDEEMLLKALDILELRQERRLSA